MGAIVLDTETTGFSPDSDRIIEICVVDFDTEEELLHSYLHPGRVLPAEITAITGITDEMLVGAPVWADVHARVVEIVGSADAMICHNPWFDRGMIAGEVRRVGGDLTFPQLVCTKRLWDVYEPKEKRHLTNAFKRFVDPAGFEGAHGARADTIACLRVFKAQRELFKLTEVPWHELDPEQKRWCGPSEHLIWRDGVLIMNFGKQKDTPVHLVERSYWNWILKQDFPEHVMVVAEYMTLVARPGITASELASWAYGRRF